MILTAQQVQEKLNITQEELELLVFLEHLIPIEVKQSTRYLKFRSKDVEEMVGAMSYHMNNLKANELEREWR